MVADKIFIEEIKDKLVKVYDPLEVYLFGSYAWGSPTDESDLDFLIVVKQSNQNAFSRIIEGSKALRALRKYPIDLVVFTKEEFDERTNKISTLCFKIKKEGKRLYAKA